MMFAALVFHPVATPQPKSPRIRPTMTIGAIWPMSMSDPRGRHGQAVLLANMSVMLEEKEIALARAELHVIEARGRCSDQLEKIARLRLREKIRWKLSRTSDYFKHTYL